MRPGDRLLAYLDGVDVLTRWQPGQGADVWSGLPDPSGPVRSSHCSAAVVALSQALGAPLPSPSAAAPSGLRAPELLLAGRLYRWLAGWGELYGWRACACAREAEARASRGLLVVAAMDGDSLEAPGHIAVVRPSRGSSATSDGGVHVINVGLENAPDTSISSAFRHHPAWPARLRCYSHASVYARA